MPQSELPERASLEYLKKRAKERLADLRRRDPDAKLAAAQLAIARDYGFTSWRALKAEVDRRRAPMLDAFFTACSDGDIETLRAMLSAEPGLARERQPGVGTTGLHLAVRSPDAVRLLLEYGADPNARDVGDNAYALHFAAGATAGATAGADGNAGPAGGAGARANPAADAIAVVRTLLDAGGDVHGFGDLHMLDVIGWATGRGPDVRQDVLTHLLERGARHHVFSAIATLDSDALRTLVKENPGALSRRLSRFEGGQSALHYVIAPPDGLMGGRFRTGEHYKILDLLIELGADLEAKDDKGRTPLALAMLLGDEEAMRRLRAAGARVPKPGEPADFAPHVAALARNAKRLDAMVAVPNVRQTVDWYRSIGFVLEGEHELDTDAAWAGVSFGNCYLMFVPSHGRRAEPPYPVSFWIMTDRVDDLCQALKQRQLDRARAVLDGVKPEFPEARFTQDIYDAFYGLREFTIVDLNGYELHFAQQLNASG